MFCFLSGRSLLGSTLFSRSSSSQSGLELQPTFLLH
ncbi:unnamed protein product [Linum tenue]|uniref:Uncharacterized protein n=1 Tax=Linum tenue TaxID=586396 RepID=A0AAV0PI93_9ROSI|nr:unnamed protein product [Linum tenue]